MDSIRNQNETTPTTTTIKILSWILQARRELTVSEMQTALSIDFGSGEYKAYNNRDILDRKSLLDICGGLVNVNEESDKLQFTHYYVGAYLSWRPSFTKSSSIGVAIACTAYLSSDAFAQGACTTYESLTTRFQLHPFMRYAALYLPYHLQAPNQSESKDVVLDFLARPKCVESFLQAQAHLHHHSSLIPTTLKNFPQNRHPLHVAITLRHLPAVRFLFPKENNLSTQDSLGQTALYAAAEAGEEEVVELLIRGGANVSLPGANGCTPLHKAAAGHRHSGIIQLLLENGADPSVKGNCKQTPLHEAVRSKQVDSVRLLLQGGADISAKDRDGWTALHLAAFYESAIVFKFLLENGADAMGLTHSKETVLHVAVRGGNNQVVKLALDTGVNTIHQDVRGMTALDMAVSSGFGAAIQSIEAAMRC